MYMRAHTHTHLQGVNVIAWGISLERPTMIKFGIDNIRDLFGPKVLSPLCSYLCSLLFALAWSLFLSVSPASTSLLLLSFSPFQPSRPR
jgi:hypothetical protein